MTFQRIATKRKSTYVAEQIIDAIRRGDYHVGDRLPPERVIGEQMGVSRPSVREALSALQVVGILESRAGDGTYVVRVPEHREVALSLLEEEESPVEALEARRVLERAVVEVAAERAPAGGLEDVEQALAEMGTAARTRDYDRFGAANVAFHVAILRLTGNDLLVRTVRPLLEIMQRQLALEMRRRAYAPDSAFFATMYEAHADIYRALAAGQRDQAVRAMDRHFDLIEASLRA